MHLLEQFIVPNRDVPINISAQIGIVYRRIGPESGLYMYVVLFGRSKHFWISFRQMNKNSINDIQQKKRNESRKTKIWNYAEKAFIRCIIDALPGLAYFSYVRQKNVINCINKFDENKNGLFEIVPNI